jgi:hypothetical protein
MENCQFSVLSLMGLHMPTEFTAKASRAEMQDKDAVRLYLAVVSLPRELFTYDKHARVAEVNSISHTFLRHSGH